MRILQNKAGNGTLQCIHVCDGALPCSAIESEHNFMDGDSQDDLLVQVSLVSVHIYVCTYIY